MFLDKDFLLNTQTARTLYHEAAEECRIIDIPAGAEDTVHDDVEKLSLFDGEE